MPGQYTAQQLQLATSASHLFGATRAHGSPSAACAERNVPASTAAGGAPCRFREEVERLKQRSAYERGVGNLTTCASGILRQFSFCRLTAPGSEDPADEQPKGGPTVPAAQRASSCEASALPHPAVPALTGNSRVFLPTPHSMGEMTSADHHGGDTPDPSRGLIRGLLLYLPEAAASASRRKNLNAVPRRRNQPAVPANHTLPKTATACVSSQPNAIVRNVQIRPRRSHRSLAHSLQMTPTPFPLSTMRYFHAAELSLSEPAITKGRGGGLNWACGQSVRNELTRLSENGTSSAPQDGGVPA